MNAKNRQVMFLNAKYSVNVEWDVQKLEEDHKFSWAKDVEGFYVKWGTLNIRLSDGRNLSIGPEYEPEIDYNKTFVRPDVVMELDENHNEVIEEWGDD